MDTKNDGPDVKAMLKADMLGLVRALGLEGRRSGNYWMARSRAHDHKIGGMYVTVAGGMAGAWRDEVTGEKGDPINLISYVKFGDVKGHARDAFAWAREHLGLGTMTPEQRERASREAQQRQKAAAVEHAQRLGEQRRIAKATYLHAKQRPFLGSPAHRYLASARGIDFELLGRVPGCLGWLPERRHTDTNTRWPVMLACFTDDAGDVAALHFTFLARDGSGKAPLPKVLNSAGELEDPNERNIWPGFKGAAMRLWRGGSRRSIAEANVWAEKHGEMETLVLCEGVEDGLSSVMAAPELRTWAAGSLGNLVNIKLPPCVDRVIVWRDNDWSKPQATKQFANALAALQGQGVEVAVARSAIGKDANDALRADLEEQQGDTDDEN